MVRKMHPRSPQMSEYEYKRLAQIRENQKVLAELGFNAKKTNTTAQVIKAKKARTNTKRYVGAYKQKKKNRVVFKPQRRSLRIKGKPPVLDKADQIASVMETDQDDDEDDDGQELLEQWKSHVKQMREEQGGGKGEASDRRQLFLIPTGIPGTNDHTLDDPVEAIGSHLWGFCEGLYSRIFLRVRPGDIMLFTSSGCGAFNRVARVRGRKVVPKSVADKFWSRMRFSMGGSCKANVGFPLLTPLDKPKNIDWDKMEVMSLLGYKDHLQSSRLIRDEILDTEGGQVVYARCIKELGISPYITEEEKLQAQTMGTTEE